MTERVDEVIKALYQGDNDKVKKLVKELYYHELLELFSVHRLVDENGIRFQCAQKEEVERNHQNEKFRHCRLISRVEVFRLVLDQIQAGDEPGFHFERRVLKNLSALDQDCLVVMLDFWNKEQIKPVEKRIINSCLSKDQEWLLKEIFPLFFKNYWFEIFPKVAEFCENQDALIWEEQRKAEPNAVRYVWLTSNFNLQMEGCFSRIVKAEQSEQAPSEEKSQKSKPEEIKSESAEFKNESKDVGSSSSDKVVEAQRTQPTVDNPRESTQPQYRMLQTMLQYWQTVLLGSEWQRILDRRNFIKENLRLLMDDETSLWTDEVAAVFVDYCMTELRLPIHSRCFKERELQDFFDAILVKKSRKALAVASDYFYQQACDKALEHGNESTLTMECMSKAAVYFILSGSKDATPFIMRCYFSLLNLTKYLQPGTVLSSAKKGFVENKSGELLTVKTAPPSSIKDLAEKDPHVFLKLLATPLIPLLAQYAQTNTIVAEQLAEIYYQAWLISADQYLLYQTLLYSQQTWRMSGELPSRQALQRILNIQAHLATKSDKASALITVSEECQTLLAAAYPVAQALSKQFMQTNSLDEDESDDFSTNESLWLECKTDLLRMLPSDQKGEDKSQTPALVNSQPVNLNQMENCLWALYHLANSHPEIQEIIASYLKQKFTEQHLQEVVNGAEESLPWVTSNLAVLFLDIPGVKTKLSATTEAAILDWSFAHYCELSSQARAICQRQVKATVTQKEKHLEYQMTLSVAQLLNLEMPNTDALKEFEAIAKNASLQPSDQLSQQVKKMEETLENFLKTPLTQKLYEQFPERIAAIKALFQLLLWKVDSKEKALIYFQHLELLKDCLSPKITVLLLDRYQISSSQLIFQFAVKVKPRPAVKPLFVAEIVKYPGLVTSLDFQAAKMLLETHHKPDETLKALVCAGNPNLFPLKRKAWLQEIGKSQEEKLYSHCDTLEKFVFELGEEIWGRPNWLNVVFLNWGWGTSGRREAAEVEFYLWKLACKKAKSKTDKVLPETAFENLKNAVDYSNEFLYSISRFNPALQRCFEIDAEISNARAEGLIPAKAMQICHSLQLRIFKYWVQLIEEAGVEGEEAILAKEKLEGDDLERRRKALRVEAIASRLIMLFETREVVFSSTYSFDLEALSVYLEKPEYQARLQKSLVELMKEKFQDPAPAKVAVTVPNLLFDWTVILFKNPQIRSQLPPAIKLALLDSYVTAYAFLTKRSLEFYLPGDLIVETLQECRDCKGFGLVALRCETEIKCITEVRDVQGWHSTGEKPFKPFVITNPDFLGRMDAEAAVPAFLKYLACNAPSEHSRCYSEAEKTILDNYIYEKLQQGVVTMSQLLKAIKNSNSNDAVAQANYLFDLLLGRNQILGNQVSNYSKEQKGIDGPKFSSPQILCFEFILGSLSSELLLMNKLVDHVWGADDSHYNREQQQTFLVACLDRMALCHLWEIEKIAKQKIMDIALGNTAIPFKGVRLQNALNWFATCENYERGRDRSVGINSELESDLHGLLASKMIPVNEVSEAFTALHGQYPENHPKRVSLDYVEKFIQSYDRFSKEEKPSKDALDYLTAIFLARMSSLSYNGLYDLDSYLQAILSWLEETAQELQSSFSATKKTQEGVKPEWMLLLKQAALAAFKVKIKTFQGDKISCAEFALQAPFFEVLCKPNPNNSWVNRAWICNTSEVKAEEPSCPMHEYFRELLANHVAPEVAADGRNISSVLEAEQKRLRIEKLLEQTSNQFFKNPSQQRLLALQYMMDQMESLANMDKHEPVFYQQLKTASEDTAQFDERRRELLKQILATDVFKQNQAGDIRSPSPAFFRF